MDALKVRVTSANRATFVKIRTGSILRDVSFKKKGAFNCLPKQCFVKGP